MFSLQTNKSEFAHVDFFLSLIMHGSQWYLGRVSTATRKLKQLTEFFLQF